MKIKEIKGKSNCIKCKQILPKQSFHKNRRAKNGCDSICKKCRIKYYNQPHVKERMKRRYVKNRYGISLEEYNGHMIDGECLICTSSENLVLDHNHQNGDVRGTLCSNCNTGLGFFQDSKLLLEKAITYLNVNGSYSEINK
jgi:hypothetical protein